MDPVSHVLLGRVLIALDRRRRLGPHTVAACVLGALAPDVDVVFAFFGWDIYLREHQAGTHSILGSLVLSVAAAALVRVCTRGGRYLSLALAAWIGALSHLAFDVFSGARLYPGWPLFDFGLTVPLVAMADPWLVGICVAGAIALWWRRRAMASAAWSVVIVIAAFLAMKGVLMSIAVSHWASARGSDASVSHAVEAQWGSLTEWNVFDRTPQALRQWRVDAFTNHAMLLFSLPVPPASPMVTASMSLDTVRNFLLVHELGFAAVQLLENGGTRVLWSDIRYCWPATSATTARSPLDCALWFGGDFDREGRPVTQIVHVGAWLQTRGP